MKLLGWWRTALVALGLGLAATAGAEANPTLVIDVESGQTLYNDMGTAPWYPASLTKLMTTYVALSKVREGKISLDTPLRVSAYAATMAPSKMGFKPGTLVTLDNALKMLMVKSPNDIAVTIAEGISGSVPAFADEMNAYADKLGLHESRFRNPNGLPDPDHVSSARDMAMIGRALFREFPEQHDLFGIAALTFGGHLIPNHNGLIGRYPGVDGMKTGYTCSAGYNVVASAERGDRHLIVVIMGAPSGRLRSERAATLFERYFSDPGAGLGDVWNLPQSDIVLPPDMRGQICGPGRRNLIAEAENEDAAIPLAPAETNPILGAGAQRAAVLGMAAGGANAAGAAGVASPGGRVSLLGPRAAFTPVRVFIGPAPGWNGPAVGPEINPAVEVSAPGPKTPPDAVAKGAVPNDDGGLPAPLALAGAPPPAAALSAASTAVKSKGRLSLKAAGKARRAMDKKAARPKVEKASAPAKPVASAKGKPAVRPKPKGRT